MTEAEFKSRLLLLGAKIHTSISSGEPYVYVEYDERIPVVLVYPVSTGRPPEPLDTAYERIVEHIRTREDKS